jgi:hypothetical protein
MKRGKRSFAWRCHANAAGAGIGELSDRQFNPTLRILVG